MQGNVIFDSTRGINSATKSPGETVTKERIEVIVGCVDNCQNTQGILKNKSRDN